MRDRIELYLNSIFQNTGIDLSERAERMAEMRGHIESLAQVRREEGACVSCCVRDAIEEFGDVRDLRRRFSREQWRRDFSGGFRATVGLSWIPALAGLFASVPVWAANTVRPGAAVVVSGLASTLIAAFVVFAVMVAARIAAVRIQRPRPKCELNAATIMLRWAGLAAGMLLGIAIAAIALAAILFSTTGGAPIELFVRKVPVAIEEQALELAGIASVFVVAIAAGLTACQRRMRAVEA